MTQPTVCCDTHAASKPHPQNQTTTPIWIPDGGGVVYDPVFLSGHRLTHRRHSSGGKNAGYNAKTPKGKIPNRIVQAMPT